MLNYNIISDLFDLRNLVDRFFEEEPSHAREREYPFATIYEGNDEIEIRATMPGVESKDLDIHLTENNLIIEGVKKDDYADYPYSRKERFFGRFNKSIKLPYRVDPAKVDAHLAKGILTVKLSRSEETKPKKIVIN